MESGGINGFSTDVGYHCGDCISQQLTYNTTVTFAAARVETDVYIKRSPKTHRETEYISSTHVRFAIQLSNSDTVIFVSLFLLHGLQRQHQMRRVNTRKSRPSTAQ